uniref:Chromate transporter n=1 Tax=Candidatus Caldatribacterium californiense TaxID=1454726 RepID=A0A7V3YFF6_9BACT
MAERHRRTFLLFLTFLKIGAFTWGGGYAMIPLIRRELVEKQKVLSEDAFLEALSIAQSLPGALAVNTASLVGLMIGGVTLQLAFVLATALPSFFSIVVLAFFFLRFRELPLVQAFFRGALAVVVSVIVLAVWQIGRKAAEDSVDLVLTVVLLGFLLVTGIHPLFVVLLGGGLGLFLRR